MVYLTNQKPVLVHFFRPESEVGVYLPQEDAWATATSDALAAAGEKGGAGSVPSRANWPLLLFFAVIIGGPYLIWKFLSSIAGNSGDDASRVQNGGDLGFQTSTSKDPQNAAIFSES